VLILTHPFFVGINWDGIESRDGSVSVPWKPQNKSRTERHRDKQRSKNGTRASATSNSAPKSKNSGVARTAVEVIDAKMLSENPFHSDGNRIKVEEVAALGEESPPVDANRSRAPTAGSDGMCMMRIVGINRLMDVYLLISSQEFRISNVGVLSTGSG
jgi:hypothetical protein